jgi:hypothetical protein
MNMFDLTVDPHEVNQPAPSTAPKSWRTAVPVHSAAAAYPRLSDDQLAELGADIKARGLQVDIVFVREDGKDLLIDGVNRLSALEAAGIDLIGKDGTLDRTLGLGGGSRVRVVADVDPVALAASLNAHRRHLTPEAKRERIENLLKATPQKSDRQIAEDLKTKHGEKTDHKVIGRTRKRLEATGATPLGAVRLGARLTPLKAATRDGGDEHGG